MTYPLNNFFGIMCLCPYLPTGTLSKIIYAFKIMFSVHANTVSRKKTLACVRQKFSLTSTCQWHRGVNNTAVSWLSGVNGNAKSWQRCFRHIEWRTSRRIRHHLRKYFRVHVCGQEEMFQGKKPSSKGSCDYLFMERFIDGFCNFKYANLTISK